jgi:hypothetical protein
MPLTIFGKSKRRISYYSHQAFEQTSTMYVTKSNDHRRMFAFKDNDIPFESIFKQDCEDCKLTSIISSIYPSSIPFPWKLHEMLDDAEKGEGFQSIISWLPDHKNGFRVHNSAAFVDLVMPKYFKQTQYKSFQRQLNIWGFCRIPSGRDKGGYVHPCFVRGKPSLCRQMVRRKIKGCFSTSKITASAATHSSLPNPLKTCASAPCLMNKEFGDAPFFFPAPVVRSPPSLQPATVSYELLGSVGVGVLLEEGSLQAGRNDFVKNYSTVDKSSSRQAISPRRSQQSRSHSLLQWIDFHDDDEQALLQVFPSNFDLESIFS